MQVTLALCWSAAVRLYACAAVISELVLQTPVSDWLHASTDE